MAAYLGASSAIDAFNASVDDLAKLDDMAQITGSSVENLSRLQKVATAFGQDFGAVDDALTKLAKGMAGADEESSKVGRALEALGISARDSDGKLRDSSEVMIEIAKKLQAYQDGAAKTALVNDLLTKSGMNLIPYMNDLAENVDKFAGVSADAAAKATEFQDKMGMVRVRAKELFTAVAVDLLPTLNDFVDALGDVKREGDNLTADGALTVWADDLAVGLSRVVDVAKFIPKLIAAVGGSLKSVTADIEYLGEIASAVSPYAIAESLSRGSNPIADLRAAKENREKAAREANEGYVDLWNYQGNAMEQAMLRRIARRNPDGSVGDFAALESGAAPSSSRSALNYTGSGDGKDKRSDYEKLISSIREKIALDERQLALGRELTPAEKEIAKIQSDRATGAIKLTDGEMQLLKVEVERQDVLDKILASRAEQEKMDKERLEASQKEISAAFESVEKLKEEVAYYGMMPAMLTSIKVAKLEMLKATLEANEGTADEIAKVEALIIASKKLQGLQESKQYLDDLSKSANDFANESQKAMENFHENIQRNLGDEMFNMLNGNFDNIGDSFKRMLYRMVADAMAADLASAIMGKGSSSSALGSLGGAFLGLFGGGAAGQIGAGASAMELEQLGAGLPTFTAAEGFDVPSGVNPITQLHEREMVLPSEHADVIRRLAANGGASGTSRNSSVSITQNIQIDSRSDRAQIMQDMLRLKEATKAEVMAELDREN